MPGCVKAWLAPLDLECYHAARMGGLVTVAMQVGQWPPLELGAHSSGEGGGCTVEQVRREGHTISVEADQTLRRIAGRYGDRRVNSSAPTNRGKTPEPSDAKGQAFFPFAQVPATHCFTHFARISVAESTHFSDTFVRKDRFWRHLKH